MGGATGEEEVANKTYIGLSPRGRGNHRPNRAGGSLERSIPAWAGQPPSSRSASTTWKVYPRVGGATGYGLPWRLATRGLSPRGRGNPRDAQLQIAAGGSIPAWAGQPYSVVRTLTRCSVYPRVGGATAAVRSSKALVAGLSPRGRGNPRQRPPRWESDRSIPAWAGQPSTRSDKSRCVAVYPRVGGATVPRDVLALPNPGLSPRGRGNHSRSMSLGVSLRSIPAWAGQPRRRRWPWCRTSVYPRVGGATQGAYGGVASGAGLSPRGRGNRLPFRPRRCCHRSIPAWAGQP